jgi:L-fucose isomerase-like protein
VTTLGIVIGNRGFFPAHLCESGRREILCVFEEEGLKPITLPVEATKFGAVESLVDAQKCADLFKAHQDERNGYEHHVAATKVPAAAAIHDALTTYLGWNIYHHQLNS